MQQRARRRVFDDERLAACPNSVLGKETLSHESRASPSIYPPRNSGCLTTAAKLMELSRETGRVRQSPPVRCCLLSVELCWSRANEPGQFTHTSRGASAAATRTKYKRTRGRTS